MKNQSIFTFSRQYSKGLIFTLGALVLVGCAGGGAKQTSEYKGKEPLPRPSAVCINDFAVDPDDVVVDTFGPNFASKDEVDVSEQVKTGRAIADALAKHLVAELMKQGITARRAKATTQIPLNALVVKGQFVTIKEGDQFSRVVVGFGAGAEKLQAQVQVYQMRENGLQQISTGEGEARGRKTPGVAGPAAVTAGTGMMAGAVVVSGMNLKSEAIDGSMQTNINNLTHEFTENAVKFYKERG